MRLPNVFINVIPLLVWLKLWRNKPVTKEEDDEDGYHGPNIYPPSIDTWGKR